MHSSDPQRVNSCIQKALKIFWIKILYLSILCMVSLSPNMYAYTSTGSGHHIRFNHITVKQGLSHNSVYAILQDSKGFMWFGTYVGLSKYDGYEFTVYKHDPENPHSLSHNAVVALYENSLGELWIGTAGGGLNRFDRNTEQFVRYQHNPDDPRSLSSDNIWAVYGDRTGDLWIGTMGGGLNRFDRDTEQFIHYQHDPDDPHGLSSNNIMSFYEDQQGNLWIGTSDSGLNRFDRDTGQFICYQHDPDESHSLSHKGVYVIYEDHLGELWVGTDAGLNRFDRATERFIHYRHAPDDPQSLSSNSIRSLAEDHLNRLWIGTVDEGLNRFDRTTERFIRYSYNPADSQSLNDNHIRSMYTDRSKILWIGTKTGGLNTYDQAAEQFLHYHKDSGNLSDNVVYAIYEDRSGVLWIGTQYGGLNQFDRDTGQFIHYLCDHDSPYSVSTNDIRAIYEDRAGNLWIGTAGGGLNQFDRNTKQFFRYQHNPDNPHSLSSSRIGCIYEDRTRVLWIGTGDGLNKFDRDTGQFIQYHHDSNDPYSLSSSGVACICEDRAGMLWIGTGNGLNKFDRDTGQFIHYYHDPDNPHSLSDNTVLSIYEDRAGVLWIGTRIGGLNKFDRKTGTVTCYRERDGLPNDTIYGILEDEQGNLWLSTNQGISKFNPQTQTFKNYDESDGLQGNEFNTGAYCKSKDGMMFFGGFKGFNAFYPEDIADNPYIPPVVITDFQLFHRPVPIGENSPLQKPISETDTLILSYKDFIFSFRFAALNYMSPEKNRYAYKLEGFDRDWNYTDSKHRLAVYTNLDPRSYVFRVKGSNNNEIWNDKGASLAIIITPPWWKTRWFQVLVLLGIVGIVFVAHRSRVRYLESRKQQLEIQVNERTQELQQEIIERKQAEEALRESEERLRLLVENADDMIFLQDLEGKYLYYSGPSQYALTNESVVGKTSFDFLDPAIAAKMVKDLKQVAADGQAHTFENEVVWKGTSLWFIDHKYPIRDADGQVIAVGTISRNITDRKLAEEQLKSSLREKEVLLKEVHHRVKNNLQVVSSLLYLQSQTVGDKQVLEILQDSMNRVKSMALVHERLYQSENLAKIDFREYVRSLSPQLFRAHKGDDSEVVLCVNVKAIFLTVEKAIPCALILNELISNALKYAFPEGHSGEIRINLYEEGDSLIFIVSDNGVSIPEDVDIHHAESLGLKLVRDLATRQLHGTIELDRAEGTTFTIVFPTTR